jgi:putative membrane protein
MKKWSFAAAIFVSLICVTIAGSAEAVSAASVSGLSPSDANFVAQANLGAPFQIDSGRIAEKKATTARIRDYAHLMVTTHIPVVDALNDVLKRKGLSAPPNTLLHGAYNAMIAKLGTENGAALDRDYVEGQVEYQKGNAALFRSEIENGDDPNLKEFARQTLPKIEDHLKRALVLAKSEHLHIKDCAAPIARPPFERRIRKDRKIGCEAASRGR